MKRLLLLRHAKAVASSKSGDKGRSLNDRGRKDAPHMAQAMRHRGYIPSHILCSTARRTVETWELAAPELGGEPEVEFSDALYLALPKTIAGAIRSVKGEAQCILVVGHNPGLEECARALARKPRADDERKRLAALEEKFPTTALAVLDFDIARWADLAPGDGALFDFLRPRDTMDG